MMNQKNSNSRQIAFEILKKIILKGSFSNILLNDVAQNKDLDQKEKNLIFVLVHGVVTWKIFLEYTTNKLINKKKTPYEIQIIIWMALYQLHFMDNIPQYAIVNEAVNLAKEVNPRFSGLVNGVLKNVIRQTPEIYEVNEKNEEKKYCLEYGFPFLLYKLIKEGYGETEAKKVVKDSVKKPEINLRVNTLKADFDDLYNEYKTEYGLKKQPEIKDCLISKKPIIATDLYRDGKITIQDKASILVGQTLNPSKDSRVLDMCSAPGGKLTNLAAIMDNTGYIKAFELAKNRIGLIEQNIKRLGVTNVELVNGNANLAIKDEQYDYILLDAPCSGFGVLKRKPEIKLNFQTNNDTINTLYETQKELIEVAYQSLKPNGEMVYSTCTINESENQARIQEFLKDHPDMEIISQTQLFGYEIDSDGFFICKLKKEGII
ncbi:16S rRNA (cytosine(967)-C(5))-methyltransferase RsmB [Mesoplasma lactucae]|uniref:16S rRNA (cytosine(967)-C(5))-methyltransferase n=1 Tax=Mesoplasma lactucae ATCC 49193 TaxID=81460 RepID=A0A291IRZ3_9MOLU|nr:16S rRNA (cytosine(967)-C(5))-methyltransferase RsmB [Mesoplasma lactucae]ATG97543.1 16S rRNA (cytosine(967)-C(5))-methyltransferase [Mesoplasma lactucae ATCC 49193]ATZ19999.1 16S rRNA (cytosine(967)-C(5))-methyltransferase [Mesoplasma lactucae ATCC 49193]MCL8217050.1 Ribosomal RNA small subunit methyltransferase B [Mesoplasma lactucae ATCC 49193]